MLDGYESPRPNAPIPAAFRLDRTRSVFEPVAYVRSLAYRRGSAVFHLWTHAAAVQRAAVVEGAPSRGLADLGVAVAVGVPSARYHAAARSSGIASLDRAPSRRRPPRGA